MKAGAMLSSERQDWQTPLFFLGLLRRVDHIGYDPATAPDNPTRAHVYSTPNGTYNRDGIVDFRDGLTMNWELAHRWSGGLLFLNPEYGRALPDWIDKWADEHTGQSALLVPTRTETDWFKKAWSRSKLRLDWGSSLLGKRLPFHVPGTSEFSGSKPAHASTVLYRGAKHARFARVFRPHGELLRRRGA